MQYLKFLYVEIPLLLTYKLFLYLSIKMVKNLRQKCNSKIHFQSTWVRQSVAIGDTKSSTRKNFKSLFSNKR